MNDIPEKGIELEPLLRIEPVPEPERPEGGADELPFAELRGIARRTARFIWPQWPHLLVFAVVGGLNGLLGLSGVLFGTDILMNKVFLGEPLSALQAGLLSVDPAAAVDVDTLGEAMRRTLRDRLLGIAAVLIAFATVSGIGLRYYLVWILQRINQALRVAMIERLEWMSLAYHADNEVGDSVYRVTQDSAMVTQVLERMVVRPIAAIVGILANVAVITVFSPWLGLLCVLVALPVFGAFALFGRPLRRRSLWVREATADLASTIQESFAAIRVIKAYGLDAARLGAFHERSRDAFQAAFELRRSFAVMKMLVLFAVGLLVLALDRFTGAWALAEAPTFGAGAIAFVSFSVWNLGAFQSTHGRAEEISGAIQEMSTLWGSVQDMAMGLDRALQILDLEPDIQEPEHPVPMPPIGDGVEFDEVSFAYDARRQTVEGVSLAAAPGTITAIVGPTGAGKTTLLSMLLRLIDPDAGSVRIGGVDLRELGLLDLRAHIAVALQENLLFATTVRENIRYAAPEASDTEVRAAARVACVDEVIDALPGGFDALLGERGSKLSTGQRQRLQVARAVIKDTPVVLLDEPTAALDAHTELELLERLGDWGRERVIFIVTHRLSTIRHADQIAVVEDGRLVELGSHDLLMARDAGRYRRLVEQERAAAAAVA